MLVEHKRFRRIIASDRLSKLEEKFKRSGIFVVFFGRHLLGVRAQVFLAAGVMRMPAIKFLMADAASAILTVTLMVGIGYLGGNSIEALKKDMTRIEHIAVVLLVILLMSWIVFRYFKSIKKSKDQFIKRGIHSIAVCSVRSWRHGSFDSNDPPKIQSFFSKNTGFNLFIFLSILVM
jgi:membrane protein DedA with SNARE-associated domain